MSLYSLTTKKQNAIKLSESKEKTFLQIEVALKKLQNSILLITLWTSKNLIQPC